MPTETPPMCAGQGKYFSLSAPEKHPEMDGYHTLTWKQIVWYASNPQNVDKHSSWWVLPSGYAGRDARLKFAQESNGKFWMFSADIDKGNLSLAAVVAGMQQVLDAGTEFLVFATKSSTDAGKKWRAFVPFGRYVPSDYFHHLAGTFNEALGIALGVAMDPVTERIQQYLYIPNRGQHYEAQHVAGAPWGATAVVERGLALAEIAQKRTESDPERNSVTVGRRKERAKERGRYLTLFNQRHPAAELLARYGFTEGTSTSQSLWHYEGQSTKSYATRVMDDGDWRTSSGTVEAAVARKGGDSFDLFVAFECGGNREAAFAAWCSQVQAEAKELLKRCPWTAGFTVDGVTIKPGISQ